MKYFIYLFTLFQLHAHALEKDIMEYKIIKGDTLRNIAFKIYGDYEQWKDLVSLNPELKDGKLDLSHVKSIKYRAPRDFFKWEPLGEPYLIKKGDTLQKISSKHYGTTKKWKDIFKNNMQLIKNPDLLFEGMTLYYIPN